MNFTWVLTLVIYFNLALFAFLLLLYLLDRRKGSNHPTDIEEFCGSLPLNAVLPDPYVLRDGKWVSTEKPQAKQS
jgi:hypothetical protein